MVLPTNPAPPVTQQRAPSSLFISPPEKDSSFSPIMNYSGWHARHHRVLGNVMGDDCASPDNGMCTNMQPGQDAIIHTNISSESDGHWPDRQIRADDRFAER